MVVIDRRESFIISTAGHFFGVPVQEDSTWPSPVLDKFFNQSACRTLCVQPVQPENDELSLNLSNDLLSGKNTLVFFKLAASIVTEENFHDLVQVTSIGGGNISALIEALRQVWAPTLKSSGFDPAFLKKLEVDLLGPHPPTSIAEEQAFWEKKSKDVTKSRERIACEEAAEILNTIKIEFENAAVSRDGFTGLEESLEAISGLVDDIWKLGSNAYNEESMKSLLEIIGHETVMLVENLVNEIHANQGQVAGDDAVSMGATVCEKWVNACERLTGLFWPHHSLHPWKDAIYIPRKCSKLGKRLRQLSELRAQHRQLIRLLTSGERTRLGADDLLQSFNDIRVLYSEDDSDIEWNRMLRKVEKGLMPAEELVAQKLKTQMADAKTPNSLLAEFRKYFDLMKRDALKRALRSEREALLSAYGDLIESCLVEPKTDDLLDIPKIIHEIQTATLSEMRLESMVTLGKELLFDLPGYEETISKVTTALKEIEKRKQYIVDSWVNEMKDAVVKKKLTLDTDSPVVELTGTSFMRVTYDPRLMTLVRESRALLGQGVELPREISDLFERASSLAGRARALQQVATFHNTIGDRMVPSQRPLMLTTALEFARAVKEQSGVVWSDPQAVDGYTNRLRELVTKFARQNSELTAKHSTLRNLVSNLFKSEAINLVGNQNIWKDTLMNMRTIVDAVEDEYGNTTAWKLHWDRQLLKALGVAYRGALPSLLRKLPEVKVELIFRDRMLQWRPSLEEIRAKIYSAIRRSLSIPMNFRGVGDVEHAQFGNLVQKSAYLFGGVYKQAEIALNAMESVKIKWLNLAAPARIDIGERLKGASPHEWTRAFKDAKQWAQEVVRSQSYIPRQVLWRLEEKISSVSVLHVYGKIRILKFPLSNEPSIIEIGQELRPLEAFARPESESECQKIVRLLWGG